MPRLGSGKIGANRAVAVPLVPAATTVLVGTTGGGAGAARAAATASVRQKAGAVVPVAAVVATATAATATAKATAAAVAPRPPISRAKTPPPTIRSRRRRKEATEITAPLVGPSGLQRSPRASRAAVRVVIRAAAPARPRSRRRRRARSVLRDAAALVAVPAAPLPRRKTPLQRWRPCSSSLTKCRGSCRGKEG